METIVAVAKEQQLPQIETTIKLMDGFSLSAIHAVMGCPMMKFTLGLVDEAKSVDTPPLPPQT